MFHSSINNTLQRFCQSWKYFCNSLFGIMFSSFSDTVFISWRQNVVLSWCSSVSVIERSYMAHTVNMVAKTITVLFFAKNSNFYERFCHNYGHFVRQLSLGRLGPSFDVIPILSPVMIVLMRSRLLLISLNNSRRCLRLKFSNFAVICFLPKRFWNFMAWAKWQADICNLSYNVTLQNHFLHLFDVVFVSWIRF